jgi:hypothetical protein
LIDDLRKASSEIENKINLFIFFFDKIFLNLDNGEKLGECDLVVVDMISGDRSGNKRNAQVKQAVLTTRHKQGVIFIFVNYNLLFWCYIFFSL